jgi:hypothetical protein
MKNMSKAKQTALLGILLSCGSISPQTFTQQASAAPLRKGTTSAASSLATKILDKKTSPLERSAAWDQLLKLPAAQKTEALRRIISASKSEDAGRAASTVVYYHVPNLSPLITSNIMRWDDMAQGMVMQSIAREIEFGYTEPWFREAARQVLRGFIQRGKRQSWEDSALMASEIVDRISPNPNEKDRMLAPGHAALVLRYSGAAADQALLQRAVALDSHSIDMWVALTSFGKLRLQEQALARATYQNTKLPEINRMYAAVALAPSDVKAAAHVVQEFRNNMTAVDKINIVEVSVESTRQMYSKEPGAWEKAGELLKIMTEYWSRVAILRGVGYLQLPVAQDLVFTLVRSSELQIRIMGGVIAIERYPERFLPLLDRKRYPAEYPDLYETLCAVFMLRHPQYKAQILKKLPATKLNAAI